MRPSSPEACYASANAAKGISYPAWDMEQAVRHMFDEPTMWQDLIGPDAPDGAAENLAETWRVFPWRWQQPWLKEAVTRIEIDEDDSTLTVTLSPEAATPLLAQIQAQDEPAG